MRATGILLVLVLVSQNLATLPASGGLHDGAPQVARRLQLDGETGCEPVGEDVPPGLYPPDCTSSRTCAQLAAASSQTPGWPSQDGHGAGTFTGTTTGDGYCESFYELSQQDSEEDCHTAIVDDSVCLYTTDFSYGKPGGTRARRCLCDTVESCTADAGLSLGADGYDRLHAAQVCGESKLELNGTNCYGTDGEFFDATLAGLSSGGGPAHLPTSGITEAAALCAAAGGRLCTRDELVDGVTGSTGCGFNAARTWSSTPCEPTYHPFEPAEQFQYRVFAAGISSQTGGIASVAPAVAGPTEIFRNGLSLGSFDLGQVWTGDVADFDVFRAAAPIYGTTGAAANLRITLVALARTPLLPPPPKLLADSRAI